MYFKAFLKPSLSYTARYAPSPRFQKHLKIHAKIAQLILLPLLKGENRCEAEHPHTTEVMTDYPPTLSTAA